jgi:ABC-type hemin transport system substrate-binding protein
VTVRVVSLVPSATETLLEWGVTPVACTRFCEQPGLPHVGGTKDPDVTAILGLAPDLVIVDEEENRREDADALTAAGLELLVTSVRTVDDARDAVVRLAARTGSAAPRWDVSPPTPVRRVAFVPIWRRPWMSINADTYGASVLDLLGTGLVTATAAERYPTVELAALSRPDVVLVPSEPYVFTDAHLDELAVAFAGVPVERVDGQDLFWWGTRTPGAVQRLARSLHQ